MKAVLIFFTCATAVCAQSALAPPQVGFLQDSVHSFRPVFGVAGNFVLGVSALDGVLSAAYSGSFGLLKTDTAIIVTGSQGQVIATTPAAPGPAVFAFYKNGSPAFAFLASAHLFLGWYSAGFQMIPFDSRLFPAGAVRAIFAPDAAHAGFLVQRVDGLWDIRVLIGTGQVESQTALAGVKAPALVLASGDLVYADANGIAIRKNDASETHIHAQLPPIFSMAQMGVDWVALTDLSTGGQFAVRSTPGRESFYSLPQVSQ